MRYIPTFVPQNPRSILISYSDVFLTEFHLNPNTFLFTFAVNDRLFAESSSQIHKLITIHEIFY